MKNTIILFSLFMALGCGTDGGGKVIASPSTAGDATDDATEGPGTASDTTVADTEDSDAQDPSDTIQADTNTPPCFRSNITGSFCDPKTEKPVECARIWVESQCGGEPVLVEEPLPAGGDFILKDIPTGIQTVNVALGGITAECTVIVNGDQDTLLTANDCECPDGCEALFAPKCWPAEVKDDCNCVDDDCDGIVDEDCIDVCDCVDADCDGEVDEDCLDICDGVDQNCNGTTDEDCPYVDQCLITDENFEDCDENGLPDTCPDCPPVEVVFVIDTSGSMVDELDALCEGIDATVQALNVINIDMTEEILGITQTLSCTHNTVAETYGNKAAGKTDDNQFPQLLTCENEDGTPNASHNSEDWGAAVAIVAANKQWVEGGIKVVIPISDEGPICGNPLDAQDQHGMEAILPFVADLGVLVYPISGTGTPAAVMELAQQFADATGGIWNETTDPESDLVLHVLSGVFDACSKTSDCNKNNIPDTCEINKGLASDCDQSGVLDMCQFTEENPAPDCDGNEVFDACDLSDGTLQDCNENTVPDVCDISAEVVPDCDANGVPDGCDLSAGTSADCNENTVPDICDINAQELPDCDANGIPDGCDIAAEGVSDCNANGVPDGCDLSDETSFDCNENGVLDTCDIAADGEIDTDGDGIPDSCGEEETEGTEGTD